MSALKLIADAFNEGGWPMWPILALMMVSWGICIERIVYLQKAGIDKEKLLALLKSQIMAGNIQGAIKVCSGNPTPMTRIIQSGLTKFNRSDAEVQAAMDEAALRELPRIEKRTGYLAMLGNVATLIGLLGTILGLIHSFGAVAGGRPLDEGHPARARHLRGHELHRLRPHLRRPRAAPVRAPQRLDPGHPR